MHLKSGQAFFMIVLKLALFISKESNFPNKQHLFIKGKMKYNNLIDCSLHIYTLAYLEI